MIHIFSDTKNSCSNYSGGKGISISTVPLNNVAFKIYRSTFAAIVQFYINTHLHFALNIFILYIVFINL